MNDLLLRLRDKGNTVLVVEHKPETISIGNHVAVLDPIRKGFAKANGVKLGLFSSNSEGACPACNGAGVVYTELGIMETVETTCEECEGKRFQAAVLEHTLGDRNIAEVLAMSVTEAREFFGDGQARTPAAHKVLDRLVESGKSVIVIEHHQAVMAHADWIVDFGTRR